MNFKRYTLLTLALLLLSSCSDFLGNTPKGYQIPETVEDYEQLLNSTDLINYSDRVLDLMTDEAYIATSLPAQFIQISLANMSPVWRRMYLFDNGYFYESDEEDQIYVPAYKRIFIYNAIIEGLKDAKGDEKYNRRVRAEALVGRALEYLMLVTIYAPPYQEGQATTALAVPLLLTDDVTKQDQPVATQKEVLDQIFSDLDEALTDLPQKPVNNAYRMSVGAAHAIYARAAFLTHRYDVALDHALKSLHENDSLLDMKPLTLNVAEWAVGARNNYPAALINPESLYIRHLTPYTGFNEYLLLGHQIPSLYGPIPEKDMRYYLFATTAPSGYEDSNPEGEITWNPAVEFNIGLSTPEMYLIAAECEARNGQTAEALDRVNKLRANRIKDYNPLQIESQHELITTIIEERQREFLFRGYFRYMDLKRLATDPEFSITLTHYDEKGNPIVADPKSPNYLKYPLPAIVSKNTQK